jgi:hypothetical protein
MAFTGSREAFDVQWVISHAADCKYRAASEIVKGRLKTQGAVERPLGGASMARISDSGTTPMGELSAQLLAGSPLIFQA